MQIQCWLKDRNVKGTLAAFVRRMVESGGKYSSLEKRIRGMYVLEAVVAHCGNQTQAAASLGISRLQIIRIIRSMGLTREDVMRAVRAIQEGQ